MQVFFRVISSALILSFLAIGAYGATFIVTTTSSSGPGSLAQAILDANANPDIDQITFNVNGGGTQTIFTGDLPRIAQPVVIDATTQPGYAGNPIIELRGPGGSGTRCGITIDGGQTTVRGFVINNYNLSGICMFNNGGNLIENNYIGTTLNGEEQKPNFGSGIRIFNSSNNTIGGPSANQRNLISGNAWAGIEMNGSNASGNVIQGNYIGTNIHGTISSDAQQKFTMRNEREGICLCSSNGDFQVHHNVIGGSAPGEGNLISANRFDEIEISGKAFQNIVQGNIIGTNWNGTVALHRNGNGGNGINIDGGSNNLIGGAEPGAGNLISGQLFGPSSGGNGIMLERAVGNIIKGNRIGTNLSGTAPIPNSEDGIHGFENVRDNVIGGILPGEGNVIAYNNRKGVTIGTSTFTSLLTNHNSIRGNSIYSNGNVGIDLFDGFATEITQNDACDVDQGTLAVNDLQNFPVLGTAVYDNSKMRISGSLNSLPNKTFAIDIYGNSETDASGYGEGKYYLGSIYTTTNSECNSTFNASVDLPFGIQFVTATATSDDGNTSEFSQAASTSSGEIRISDFDFDGDGRADLSMRRPADDNWYIRRTTAGFTIMTFGVAGDRMVPADYDGDGKTDVAMFRPSSGTWYKFNSQSQTFSESAWGQDGDLPAPADHDGDGKADLVVFRPSAGMWYVKRADNTISQTQFGTAEDKPVIGDFDGDGKFDIGVFRASDNNWYTLRTTEGFWIHTWGQAGDIPVPADYDGDGETDIAIFRPATGQWYRILSTSGFDEKAWGQTGDTPVPADYDGDGKADIGVFRSTDATWYIVGSSSGQIISPFGAAGDIPTPSAFIY